MAVGRRRLAQLWTLGLALACAQHTAIQAAVAGSTIHWWPRPSIGGPSSGGPDPPVVAPTLQWRPRPSSGGPNPPSTALTLQWWPRPSIGALTLQWWPQPYIRDSDPPVVALANRVQSSRGSLLLMALPKQAGHAHYGSTDSSYEYYTDRPTFQPGPGGDPLGGVTIFPPLKTVPVIRALNPAHNGRVCSMWGNFHYKTFDGDIFRFPGLCNYVLASHCRAAYEDFNIQVRRSQEAKATTPSKVVMKLDGMVLELTKDSVLVNDHPVQLPFSQSGVLIEKSNMYLKVVARLGLVFMWNLDDSLLLELDDKYANQTCGLCGDFNGLPVFNEFLSNNVKLTPTEYGNLQKLDGPMEQCQDAAPMPTRNCTTGLEFCQGILLSQPFSGCHDLVNTSSYIEACQQDICLCADSDPTNCSCPTLAEYARQCVHAGGVPQDWRTSDLCPAQACPFNMEHHECGLPCPNTCSNLEHAQLCEDHCISGCFCPEGMVLDDITQNGCVAVDHCSCTYNGLFYAPGDVYSTDCTNCTCSGGRWNCQDTPCPGTCSVLGGSHFSTFDEKQYTVHGDCSYVLAKPCDSSAFTVLAELRKCGLTDSETCLKSVTLSLGGGQTVIVVKASNEVFVNQIYTKLPISAANITLFKPSTFFIIAQTNLGLQLDIQLVPTMQVFLRLAPELRGLTCGLCGNFNSIQADDFQTISGVVEGTAAAFFNTWKTQASCPNVKNSFEDPCSLSVENEKYAQYWCSQLTDAKGPFALCHASVNPATYYSNCLFDTCNCEKSEDCLCAALSAYVHTCAAKGVLLRGWRDGACTKPVTTCPESLTYRDYVSTCQPTCRSLSEEDVICHISFVPVDGCVCAEDTYLDDSGKCVPAASCPCYYGGSPVLSGESVHDGGAVCTCNQGKLTCVGGHTPTPVCAAPMVYFDCQNITSGAAGPSCQKSCHTLDVACYSSPCISGCVCPDGLVSDGEGGCVAETECPCVHNEASYTAGQTIRVGCNTCTCKNRMWQCTQEPCLATCAVYGDGHYLTFDGQSFTFDGDCEYTLVQDHCGSNSSAQGSFRVVTENIPCGTTGTTCSKAIKIFLGSYELKLSDGKVEVIEKGAGQAVPYSIRQMGIYLVVDTDVGLVLQWDKKTSLFLRLSPEFKGKVCGLCGNFDGNAVNDFTTRSQSVVGDVLEFGNSWKFSPSCPDARAPRDPCTANPYRKSWAQKQCSILHGATFAACHAHVEPTKYYEACVSDACACDSGGDCECFCTAVAAYAQACHDAGVCVSWRSPDVCPLFCDYYNPQGECEWHYQPCGVPCMRTCRNPSGRCLHDVSGLEGCYPRCPPEAPIFDEDKMQCVPQCRTPPPPPPCRIRGKDYQPGASVPSNENCHTCICTENGVVCAYDAKACVCTYDGRHFHPGDVIYHTADGTGSCLSAHCTANGTIERRIGLCDTSTAPTTTFFFSSTPYGTSRVSTVSTVTSNTLSRAPGTSSGSTVSTVMSNILSTTPGTSSGSTVSTVTSNTLSTAPGTSPESPVSTVTSNTLSTAPATFSGSTVSTVTSNTLSTAPGTSPGSTASTVMSNTLSTAPGTSPGSPVRSVTSNTLSTAPGTSPSPGCGEVCQWTPWLEVSHPGRGVDSGDFDTLQNLRAHGFRVCQAPREVKCRAENTPNVPLEALGQHVECSRTVGLICYNKDQPSGLCDNYQIRILCCSPAPCSTTSHRSALTSTSVTSGTTQTTAKPGTKGISSSEGPSTATSGSVHTASTTLSTASTPPAPGTSTPIKTSLLTPSPTPETTETTSSTEPSTVACLQEMCKWTKWLDGSYPGPGRNGGDFDTFHDLRAKGYNICEHPKEVECRAAWYPDVPLDELGQDVICNTKVGLLCLNKNQLPPICYNYEIRILCCELVDFIPYHYNHNPYFHNHHNPYSYNQLNPCPYKHNSCRHSHNLCPYNELNPCHYNYNPYLHNHHNPCSYNKLNLCPHNHKPSPTSTTVPETTHSQTIPITCQQQCTWTKWFDVDIPSPGPNGGDVETYDNIIRHGEKVCHRPEEITKLECRAQNHPMVSIEKLGQVVECNSDVGLVCQNRDQTGTLRMCLNYEIRVLYLNCHCQQLNSKHPICVDNLKTCGYTHLNSPYNYKHHTCDCLQLNSKHGCVHNLKTCLYKQLNRPYNCPNPYFPCACYHHNTCPYNHNTIPINCRQQCTWTKWFDVDFPSPGPNGGDVETYDNIIRHGEKVCHRPEEITKLECRAEKYPVVSIEKLGQVVECNSDVGLVCRNRDQTGTLKKCLNYEIRVLYLTCHCHQLNSKHHVCVNNLKTCVYRQLNRAYNYNCPNPSFPCTIPINCRQQCTWTKWFDVDFPSPGPNGGDVETYDNIIRHGEKVCHRPEEITKLECRAEKYPVVSIEKLGQVVECNSDVGLVCRNRDQTGTLKTCLNYEIRVLYLTCHCHQLNSKHHVCVNNLKTCVYRQLNRAYNYNCPNPSFPSTTPVPKTTITAPATTPTPVSTSTTTPVPTTTPIPLSTSTSTPVPETTHSQTIPINCRQQCTWTKWFDVDFPSPGPNGGDVETYDNIIRHGEKVCHRPEEITKLECRAEKYPVVSIEKLGQVVECNSDVGLVCRNRDQTGTLKTCLNYEIRVLYLTCHCHQLNSKHHVCVNNLKTCVYRQLNRAYNYNCPNPSFPSTTPVPKTTITAPATTPTPVSTSTTTPVPTTTPIPLSTSTSTPVPETTHSQTIPINCRQQCTWTKWFDVDFPSPGPNGGDVETYDNIIRHGEKVCHRPEEITKLECRAEKYPVVSIEKLGQVVECNSDVGLVCRNRDQTGTLKKCLNYEIRVLYLTCHCHQLNSKHHVCVNNLKTCVYRQLNRAYNYNCPNPSFPSTTPVPKTTITAPATTPTPVSTSTTTPVPTTTPIPLSTSTSTPVPETTHSQTIPINCRQQCTWTKWFDVDFPSPGPNGGDVETYDNIIRHGEKVCHRPEEITKLECRAEKYPVVSIEKLGQVVECNSDVGLVCRNRDQTGTLKKCLNYEIRVLYLTCHCHQLNSKHHVCVNNLKTCVYRQLNRAYNYNCPNPSFPSTTPVPKTTITAPATTPTPVSTSTTTPVPTTTPIPLSTSTSTPVPETTHSQTIPINCRQQCTWTKWFDVDFPSPGPNGGDVETYDNIIRHGEKVCHRPEEITKLECRAEKYPVVSIEKLGQVVECNSDVGLVCRNRDQTGTLKTCLNYEIRVLYLTCHCHQLNSKHHVCVNNLKTCVYRQLNRAYNYNCPNPSFPCTIPINCRQQCTWTKWFDVDFPSPGPNGGDVETYDNIIRHGEKVCHRPEEITKLECRAEKYPVVSIEKLGQVVECNSDVGLVCRNRDQTGTLKTCLNYEIRTIPINCRQQCTWTKWFDVDFPSPGPNGGDVETYDNIIRHGEKVCHRPEEITKLECRAEKYPVVSIEKLGQVVECNSDVGLVCRNRDQTGTLKTCLNYEIRVLYLTCHCHQLNSKHHVCVNNLKTCVYRQLNRAYNYNCPNPSFPSTTPVPKTTITAPATTPTPVSTSTTTPVPTTTPIPLSTSTSTPVPETTHSQTIPINCRQQCTWTKWFDVDFPSPGPNGGDVETYDNIIRHGEKVCHRPEEITKLECRAEKYPVVSIEKLGQVVECNSDVGLVCRNRDQTGTLKKCLNYEIRVLYLTCHCHQLNSKHHVCVNNLKTCVYRQLNRAYNYNCPNPSFPSTTPVPKTTITAPATTPTPVSTSTTTPVPTTTPIPLSTSTSTPVPETTHSQTIPINCRQQCTWTKWFDVDFPSPGPNGGDVETYDNIIRHGEKVCHRPEEITKLECRAEKYPVVSIEKLGQVVECNSDVGLVCRNRDQTGTLKTCLNYEIRVLYLTCHCHQLNSKHHVCVNNLKTCVYRQLNRAYNYNCPNPSFPSTTPVPKTTITAPATTPTPVSTSTTTPVPTTTPIPLSTSTSTPVPETTHSQTIPINCRQQCTWTKWFDVDFPSPGPNGGDVETYDNIIRHGEKVCHRPEEITKLECRAEKYPVVSIEKLGQVVECNSDVGLVCRNRDQTGTLKTCLNYEIRVLYLTCHCHQLNSKHHVCVNNLKTCVYRQLNRAYNYNCPNPSFPCTIPINCRQQCTWTKWFDVDFPSPGPNGGDVETYDNIIRHGEKVCHRPEEITKLECRAEKYPVVSIEKLGQVVECNSDVGLVCRNRDQTGTLKTCLNYEIRVLYLTCHCHQLNSKHHVCVNNLKTCVYRQLNRAYNYNCPNPSFPSTTPVPKTTITAPATTPTPVSTSTTTPVPTTTPIPLSTSTSTPVPETTHSQTIPINCRQQCTWTKWFDVDFPSPGPNGGDVETYDNIIRHGEKVCHRPEEITKLECRAEKYPVVSIEKLGQVVECNSDVGLVCRNRDQTGTLKKCLNYEIRVLYLTCHCHQLNSKHHVCVNNLKTCVYRQLNRAYNYNCPNPSFPSTTPVPKTTITAPATTPTPVSTSTTTPVPTTTPIPLSTSTSTPVPETTHSQTIPINCRQQCTWTKWFDVDFPSPGPNGGDVETYDNIIRHGEKVCHRPEEITKLECRAEKYPVVSIEKLGQVVECNSDVGLVCRNRDQTGTLKKCLNYEIRVLYLTCHCHQLNSKHHVCVNNLKTCVYRQLNRAYNYNCPNPSFPSTTPVPKTTITAPATTPTPVSTSTTTPVPTTTPIPLSTSTSTPVPETTHSQTIPINCRQQCTWTKWFDVDFPSPGPNGGDVETYDNIIRHGEKVCHRPEEITKLECRAEKYPVVSIEKLGQVVECNSDVGLVCRNRDQTGTLKKCLNYEIRVLYLTCHCHQLNSKHHVCVNNLKTCVYRQLNRAYNYNCPNPSFPSTTPVPKTTITAPATTPTPVSTSTTTPVPTTTPIPLSTSTSTPVPETTHSQTIPINCRQQCTWTKWFDVDFPSPGPNGGDVETYDNIIRHGEKVCHRPEEITKLECRAEKYPVVSIEKLGQVVECNSDVGLVCRNRDQTGTLKKCLNYEIRVLYLTCHCHQLNSKHHVCVNNLKTCVYRQLNRAYNYNCPNPSFPSTTSVPKTTITAPATTPTPVSTSTTTPVPTTTPIPLSTSTSTPVPETTHSQTIPINCRQQCTWTKWFDVDFPSPGPNGGDVETYDNIIRHGEKVCHRPEEITKLECRAENHPVVSIEKLGQVVECNPDVGLVCRNRDQIGTVKMCLNYEIRVLCCQHQDGCPQASVPPNVTSPTARTVPPVSTSVSSTRTSLSPVTNSTTVCYCVVDKKFYPAGSIIYQKTDLDGHCFYSQCSQDCHVVKNTSSNCPPTTPSPTPATSPSSGCSDLVPPRKKGETWNTPNCTRVTCEGHNVTSTQPVKCPSVREPTCANGYPPVKVVDADGCCYHYNCQCVCSGWGDPHYITFDGTYYTFLDNCTYVLVQQIVPKYGHFRVLIDNYFCNARDGLSCPQSIIVEYQQDRVVLTQKPGIVNISANQIIFNDKEVRPGFRSNGIIVSQVGIKMYVSIPAIGLQVMFTGLIFSVEVPFSKFANNTEGQCGICSNDQKDDCSLPGGDVTTSCSKASSHWKVTNPDQPHCYGPSPTPLPTTSSKLQTSPTPCPPAPICQLILSKVFDLCHKVIPPWPYYEGCVFDHCHMRDPKVACSSLEIYASLCASEHVCIDWRGRTNNTCPFTCPAHQVYQPCGPVNPTYCYGNNTAVPLCVPPTPGPCAYPPPPAPSPCVYPPPLAPCVYPPPPAPVRTPHPRPPVRTPHFPSLLLFQDPRSFTEGCFCDEGLTLFSSSTPVCVPTNCQQCLGPSGEPVEPGQTIINNCQECTCDPSTRTLACRTQTCPPAPDCHTPGHVLVHVPLPANQCCPEYQCVCNTSSCPQLAPCPKGSHFIQTHQEGECCLSQKCIYDVCVVNGSLYQPGAVVSSGLCETCRCQGTDDPETDPLAVICEIQICQSNCPVGFQYRVPAGQCCGSCVQVACVMHTSNGSAHLFYPGETWSEPGNPCETHECEKHKDELVVVTTRKACPVLQCPQNEALPDEDGCCLSCPQQPPQNTSTCAVYYKQEVVRDGGCSSTQPVRLAYCQGNCGDTTSMYSFEANMVEHRCRCCHELRTSLRNVTLSCRDGSTRAFSYHHIEECGCVGPRCDAPGSSSHSESEPEQSEEEER
ncbi:mucin-5AC [Trichechus inunguis]